MKRGTLFYVVGASGAGKDTVSRRARSEMDGRMPVIFAHRYITRPAAAGGENHIEVSENEFLMRRENGLFAMEWQSHGNLYGIGIEADLWLEKGFNVVVNGSREYLCRAAEKYPDMIVVLIRVSRDVLRKRLGERKRESPEEIEKRMERSDALPQVVHANRYVIDNDDSLENSVKRFLEIVTP